MKYIKHILLSALCILVSSNYLSAQDSDYELDHSDPVKVVEGMIHASKAQDLHLLYLVYDPFIEGGEMYEYMRVYQTGDEDLIEDIYEISESYVNGEAEYSEDGKHAMVPMMMVGPEDSRQESILLVKRYGNWYIHGF